MTTIVAMLTDEGAYMAADSAVTDANTGWRTQSRLAKIKQIGRLLVGSAGGIREAAIVMVVIGRRAELIDPAFPWDWMSDLGPFLLNALQDQGLDLPNTLIVGYGLLAEIMTDGGVLLHTAEYAAIGSGQGYAVGALGALLPLAGKLNLSILTPVGMLETALEIAAQHDSRTAPPFLILSDI